jgi:hypothetical protein
LLLPCMIELLLGCLRWIRWSYVGQRVTVLCESSKSILVRGNFVSTFVLWTSHAKIPSLNIKPEWHFLWWKLLPPPQNTSEEYGNFRKKHLAVVSRFMFLSACGRGFVYQCARVDSASAVQCWCHTTHNTRTDNSPSIKSFQHQPQPPTPVIVIMFMASSIVSVLCIF